MQQAVWTSDRAVVKIVGRGPERAAERAQEAAGPRHGQKPRKTLRGLVPWCCCGRGLRPKSRKLTGGVKLLKKEMALKRARAVLNLPHLGRQLGPLVPLATQRHLLCSQASVSELLVNS